MLRLKDRQRQIPGGYRFYLPELKWSAPGNFPSFTVVCSALNQVIRANAYLATKHHWPVDEHGIESWVDLYNATVCSRMGWADYVLEDVGGTLPKSSPPPHNLASLSAAAARAKELVAGARTLVEWIDSGAPPVDRDLAQSRALICSTCPKNEKGDWTHWFTTPAAELIRRQVQKAADRSISTVYDEKLHLCVACHCPLKLKVHVPIDWIAKRLSPDQIAKLKEAPNCWILSEISTP